MFIQNSKVLRRSLPAIKEYSVVGFIGCSDDSERIKQILTRQNGRAASPTQISDRITLRVRLIGSSGIFTYRTAGADRPVDPNAPGMFGGFNPQAVLAERERLFKLRNSRPQTYEEGKPYDPKKHRHVAENDASYCFTSDEIGCSGFIWLKNGKWLPVLREEVEVRRTPTAEEAARLNVARQDSQWPNWYL